MATKIKSKRVAYASCNGGCHAKKKMEYQAASCEAAIALCEGGPLECEYGCLGCGSCVAVCKFGALSIGANGVAQVDPDACIGCGKCTRACPRGVLHLRERAVQVAVRCGNRDKAIDPQTKRGARTVCERSCIGCGLCEKSCPSGAVRVIENLAVIDEEKCLSCGMCVVKCPRGVLQDMRGILHGKVRD